ncbi:response regulator [Delftia sp. K82]|uniref:response regulator n=1 Tax=Delftia sp. K82 TaxID=1472718 RepID=UPI00211ACEF8|nr:response regulator [Delftia sp. K82]
MKNFVLRILIADDHPAVLAGIESVLEDKHEIEIVGRAKNSTEIISFLKKNECDVLVTDYSMPGGTYGDGLVMLNVIRKRFPSVKHRHADNDREHWNHQISYQPRNLQNCP